MSQSRKLNTLIIFQPLQNPRVLRTYIPLNYVLHKPYLFNTVLQTMQLRYYFVTFINQIRSDRLDQVVFTQSIGISHLQYAMQLL